MSDQPSSSERLLGRGAPTIPTTHLNALRRIVATLSKSPIDWALTGSTSFALQGVPITVGDIDVQTDAVGAYDIATCFSECMVVPVQHCGTARIRSHFGVLELEGVRVELMGALQKRLPTGAWQEPVDIRLHRRWVQYEHLALPVLSLAYEAQAYRLLGRDERANLLLRYANK